MSRTIRKNYKTGKKERDDYHRQNRATRSCGHPAECLWCFGNRMYQSKKEKQRSEYREQKF